MCLPFRFVICLSTFTKRLLNWLNKSEEAYPRKLLFYWRNPYRWPIRLKSAGSSCFPALCKKTVPAMAGTFLTLCL